MRKIAHTDIYVFSIFGIIAIFFFTLNYSGFCFKKFRYLSSRERIEFLFDIWNKSSSKVFLKDGEYKEFKRVKRYSNLDELLVQNPDCCTVDPGGPYETGKPDFIARVLGYNSGKVISLKFQEEFIDENGKLFIEDIQIEDRLQNCGESIW